MILTAGQEKGLKIILQRFKDKEKYTVVSGYAGVGKSTLVKFAIEALDFPEEQICYATFTGKAASVLQQMGNKNAMTLHKLLYKSYPKIDGGFIHIPKEYLEYRLIVVDEVSMAPKPMMDLLFKYPGIYVICLGDPFQIPPINKDEDNHLLDHPHVFLDEVMRQAKDSDIICLSMDIRAGKPLKKYSGTNVRVVEPWDVELGMYKWADQIIVPTNKKRTQINNDMRVMYGKSGNPQDGDKVICCRNYWDIISTDGNALVNGTIGYIKNSYNNFVSFYGPKAKYIYPKRVSVIDCDLTVDNDDEFIDLSLDKKRVETNEDVFSKKIKFFISKNSELKKLEPLEFEYGYAITGHRSQGSQWNKVLVFEENFPPAEEHPRWLYTSATRAIDKLVLVRK